MFAMTVAFSIQQLFNNVIPENFPMIFPQLYLLREIFPTNGNIFYNDTRSTRIFFFTLVRRIWCIFIHGLYLFIKSEDIMYGNVKYICILYSLEVYKRTKTKVSGNLFPLTVHTNRHKQTSWADVEHLCLACRKGGMWKPHKEPQIFPFLLCTHLIINFIWTLETPPAWEPVLVWLLHALLPSACILCVGTWSTDLVL